MLDVQDLHVEVDGRRVLNGVSLGVSPGELVVILGPNGSGKSTLLHTVMGDPRFTVVSGKILLDGEDICSLSPDERAKRGLFLAFQSPPDIQGITLASLLLRASDRERDPGAFSDLVDLTSYVGLDQSHLSRSLNMGFSGGERKRSELLQASFLDRKYLLLDEVDSGVDAEGLRRFASILEDFRASGKGIILVSHNPTILDFLTVDRVVVLKAGKILHAGGPELIDATLRGGNIDA